MLERLREEQEKTDAARHSEIIALMPSIRRVERIVKFLQMEPRDLTIHEDDIHTYERTPFKEKLGTLFQDSCLNIELFIVENRKPKNKCTLAALGKSNIPLEELWGSMYGYGLPTFEHDWYTVKTAIREAPTPTELKAWLSRNRNALIVRLLGDYPRVKDEYEQVRRNYRLEDFKEWVGKKEQ